MNFGLFLCCLLGIQALCLCIGRRGSSTVQDREGYFLAGRSLKTFSLTMTFIATQIGGGVLLGAAEEAARYGYAVILYPLGVALGLIFLGVGPGKKLALGSIATVVTLFESVYKSKKLRKMAFLLSALSLFFILVAQIVALDKLFGVFTYGKYLTAIFWITLVFYTSTGGFCGVVRTDIVQAGFLLIAVLTCAVSVWYGASQFTPILSNSVFESLPTSKLPGWIFMPMIFMIVEQDMAQRCVAASSPRRLQWAAIFAGIVILLFNLIPLFLGSLGAKLGVSPGCVLIDTVAYVSGPSLAAIMAAAIGVAILSTADSLISAAAHLISEEVPQLSSLNYRYLIGMIAVFAPVAALGFSNIVDLLMLSYGLSVCCLSVPLGAALLTRYQASTPAAWAAVLTGGSVYISGYFITVPFSRDVIAWLSSLTAFIFIEILYVYIGKPSEEKV
ncbi:sodium:solute symporter family protein [Chlamydia psittaci]|uniref:Sodium:solute symporter family protein n=1 Tax=Chlamydophila parapsittaci TaxID=344886 RepID=A0ABX5VYV9_9CHLA|nr:MULTISPECIES: sodium:solute symporter family protein [Chlamydia]QDE37454.1 sodium:solute symporter family protein [Chlamydophila parapsittaci]QHE19115.1 sodium:solute symporter family protein [Chlamydia psittaci]